MMNQRNTYMTWKAVPEFPRIFPERDDSEVQARANGRRDVESEATRHFDAEVEIGVWINELHSRCPSRY